MRTKASRGLPIQLEDLYEYAQQENWERCAVLPISLDWPPSQDYHFLANWHVDDIPLAVVEDRYIARTYLWSPGKGGITIFQGLAARNVIFNTPSLVQSARHSASSWNDLNNSLYDVVAGSIDPCQQDVLDVWVDRLNDPHPLVRLVASWVGPYLEDEHVASALADRANHDDDARVRKAASNAKLAVDRLSHS